MIASRTRHLVSPASSKIAGNRDCDNWLTPITERKYCNNFKSDPALYMLHTVSDKFLSQLLSGTFLQNLRSKKASFSLKNCCCHLSVDVKKWILSDLSYLARCQLHDYILQQFVWLYIFYRGMHSPADKTGTRQFTSLF